ncbi:MAG TPA: hypothetical protein PKJ83_17275 [Cyclobacteriaceae bacterium]|nr:hypothetical protein [Cyclobacteriaceae bacterium]
MDKEKALKEIEGKIEAAQAAVSISYIIGTGCWMKDMSTYATPATITIKSAKNDHLLKIIDPRKIVTRYEDPKMVNNDSINIIRLSIVDMLTQTFEIVKTYSKETDQYEIFQKRPWFHFMRHLRNAFNHNFIFTGIGSKDQPSHIQFSDRKIEITESMNGIEIDLDILPIKYCYELGDIMLTSFKTDFK